MKKISYMQIICIFLPFSLLQNLHIPTIFCTFAPDLGTRTQSATRKGTAVSNPFLDHAYFK